VNGGEDPHFSGGMSTDSDCLTQVEDCPA